MVMTWVSRDCICGQMASGFVSVSHLLKSGVSGGDLTAVPTDRTGRLMGRSYSMCITPPFMLIMT